MPCSQGPPWMLGLAEKAGIVSDSGFPHSDCPACETCHHLSAWAFLAQGQGLSQTLLGPLCLEGAT